MKNYVLMFYLQLCDKLGRKSRLLWRNSVERGRLKNTNFTNLSQNSNFIFK